MKYESMMYGGRYNVVQYRKNTHKISDYEPGQLVQFKNGTFAAVVPTSRKQQGIFKTELSFRILGKELNDFVLESLE